MTKCLRQTYYLICFVTLLAFSDAFVVPSKQIVTKNQIHTPNINRLLLSPSIGHLTKKYASKDLQDKEFGMRHQFNNIFSKQSIGSFKNEALKVHTSFPQLLKRAFRFALVRVVILVIFTAVAYMISPHFGRQVLTLLLNILIALSNMTSNIVGALFFFPIALLALLTLLLPMPFIYLSLQLPESPIKKVLVICSETYMTVVQTLIRSVLQCLTNENLGSRTIFDWASERPLLLYVGAVLIAPILEEIIYRSFLLFGIKRLWARNVRGESVEIDHVAKESKSIETKGDDGRKPEILGYSPWVLLSSIFFAVSHASNYVGPFLNGFKINPNNEIAVMQLVTAALIQCFVAGFMSLKIFSPVFERSGLLAAIGAHAMWNLNANMLFISLPVRLVGRLLRGNKRK
mmetsp:Transcript_23067/g.32203  ORF Transcript_23067/g.32203 Transcript_23067/m.32203 type:complete len:402 (+) Transcript_23067:184-1389(+)